MKHLDRLLSLFACWVAMRIIKRIADELPPAPAPPAPPARLAGFDVRVGPGQCVVIVNRPPTATLEMLLDDKLAAWGG